MHIFANFRNPISDPYLLYIKEKFGNKPITFWYDRFPESQDQLNINPYNFLFIHEPNEFFGYATPAIKFQDLYTAILSWDQNILDNCHAATPNKTMIKSINKPFICLFR